MSKKLLRSFSTRVPRWLKDCFPECFKRVLRRQYLPRTVLIDIVGACNLRCPSCPGGSSNNKGGIMSLKMFSDIMKRIAEEQPGATVSIFNWTDPMIHPNIAEFIEVIRSFGLKSRVSTNLNILRDTKRFASANPDFMTISLSGFTQEVYAVGHRGGNIETVKENMKSLSIALRDAGASTSVTVYYHKYLYNLDEIELMKKYAESLSFSFGADWAYYMPIERVHAYMETRLPSDNIKFVVNNFALDIRGAVEAAMRFRNEPCLFPTTQLTIDCRGNVQLCCAVYDSEQFTIGSFLDRPWKEIEEKLLNNPYCIKCKSYGLHIYASWHGHKKIRQNYEAIADEQCKRHNSIIKIL
jgi:MoaA/NifB/PqqE/SkfB family radical SAM enzyme